MKRILALIASAIALAACSNALGPSDRSTDQAKASLKAAAKTPQTGSTRLAAN